MRAIGRTSAVCSQVCRADTVQPMDETNMIGSDCILKARIAKATESNIDSMSPSVIVIVIIGRFYP